MTRALFLGLLLATSVSAQPQVGDPAPDVTVRTIDGEAFALSDLRGRYVLVEFWATWCAPCIVKAPAFAALYAETPRDRFEIVGIALDDADSVRAFAERFGHTWPQGIEPHVEGRPATAAFDVVGYPTSVLIDPEGMIVYRAEGGLGDPIEAVRAVLAETPDE